jgi:hypothetical protein
LLPPRTNIVAASAALTVAALTSAASAAGIACP